MRKVLLYLMMIAVLAVSACGGLTDKTAYYDVESRMIGGPNREFEILDMSFWAAPGTEFMVIFNDGNEAKFTVAFLERGSSDQFIHVKPDEYDKYDNLRNEYSVTSSPVVTLRFPME